MTLDDMLDRTPRIKHFATVVLLGGLLLMVVTAPLFAAMTLHGHPMALHIGTLGVIGGVSAVCTAVVLVAVSAIVSRKGRT
jgi:hypothetical protein